MADTGVCSAPADPRRAGCGRAECLAAFRDGAGSDDGLGHDEGGYDEGGYDWQHCNVEGCHEWYWRGKNGEDCYPSGARACEGCAHHAGERDPDSGEWACPRCAPQIFCRRCGARVTHHLVALRGADEALDSVRRCRNPACRPAGGRDCC